MSFFQRLRRWYIRWRLFGRITPVVLVLALAFMSHAETRPIDDQHLNANYGFPQGGGITARDIHLPTSSPLNLTDCSPAVVGNSAVGGALTVNLCPARAGMQVWVVWEDATVNLIIEPDSDDTISTPEVTGAGDGLTWTATGTTGSIIQLISLADGEWRVFSAKGTAAVDNNSGF